MSELNPLRVKIDRLEAEVERLRAANLRLYNSVTQELFNQCPPEIQDQLETWWEALGDE